jgi:hypothetical protein
VLLAPFGPVRISAVAEGETAPRAGGRMKVSGEGVAALLDIWGRVSAWGGGGGMEGRGGKEGGSICTLMMIVLVAVRRLTLQNSVPVGLGSVLGRYSSPLLTLKSCGGGGVRGGQGGKGWSHLLDVEAGGAVDGAGAGGADWLGRGGRCSRDKRLGTYSKLIRLGVWKNG